MDTDEREEAQYLAIEHDIDINPENEDDLQLLLDADLDNINLSHVKTVLEDGGISDLDSAIEIVRNANVATKKDLIEEYIDITGIDDGFRYLLDRDHVWDQVTLDRYLECEDGDFIEIP